MRTRIGPIAIGLCAAALAFLAEAAVTAQESNPFDEGAFDAATASPTDPASTSSVAAAEAAKTEYLVGGSALISAASFFPASLDGYAVSGSAVGKLFGKVSVPDFGSLYMSYYITQAFFEARGGSGAAALAPALDLSSPSYALGELFYSFDFGKKLFVRIGKQLLAWGPSRIWSPVDFVNAQRENFFSSLDLRQGEPGLKLFLPLGKASAILFTDFSDLVVRDPATGSVSTAGFDATRVAARLDATVAGFELGLSGFAASSAQAKAGFDFSGDFLGSAVYGELSLAPAYSSYAASYSASLGLSRVLGDLKRWTISAEAFYESAGAAYIGDAAAMASLQPLYIGKYYGYLSLQDRELFSPSLATSLYALANFSDLSYSINLKEDFSFPRVPPFSLNLSYAGGGTGKEFTYLAGDGSLSLSAQTLIEF